MLSPLELLINWELCPLDLTISKIVATPVIM